MAKEERDQLVADQIEDDAVADIALEKTERYEVLAQLNEDWVHHRELESFY